MPVHIRDMKSLPDSIKDQFERCSNWIMSKTRNTFSTIPFEQAHEQENKIVKDLGGVIGITENFVAFRRWMLSVPEISRKIKQFEEEYIPDNDDTDNPNNFQHHEQGLSSQRNFEQQVVSLSKTINEMGNPFLDDFPNLVCLDSATVQASRWL
ncbi:hypothetical protein JTB14_036747 [Gonioctena quinquepunctata]|nr:hypothetical protein JTB14_036747 [Gonioctena quinquepunctata]